MSENEFLLLNKKLNICNYSKGIISNFNDAMIKTVHKTQKANQVE